MSLVVIPDPSLVVLVGAAGSGKTTFAARAFRADEVLSSDAFRRAIAGDERDQGATKRAFAALHRALTARLAARRLTVVDATSVERHARRALLRRAREASVPAIAIVLDLPPAVVLARNASRADRRVDEAVVRHHLARLRTAVEAELGSEGWSAIVRTLDPDALDALRIERRPSSREAPPPRRDVGGGPRPGRPAHRGR